MNLETSIGREPGTYSDYGFVGSDENSSRRKLLPLLLVGLVIIAVLAAAWFAMRTPTVPAKPAAMAAQKDSSEAPHVTVVVPGRQLVDNVVSVTGTLAAKRDMPVGAVGEGGMVVRVWVEQGQWVRAGQVLASVERSVQVQQVAQAAAQVTSAEADARLAQAEVDRASALVSRGYISKADMQRKVATRDSAAARVRVARAQLGETRARVGRLDIRAPAAGLVLARNVEPGQVVSAGAGVLFRIAMGGQFELRAKMSEADLAQMHVGLSARVLPVGASNEFAGQIWQISPVIDPQTRQGEARIALPYSRDLRPGGFASARITAGTASLPLLAESAVLSDAKGNNYVYIVGADNKIERRDIKVSSINDQGVSIMSGLDGNERVVFSAGGFLNPGETVNPDMLKPAK